MERLYETRTGRVIYDYALSEKMFAIYNERPEAFDENSTGYEWSEMGMATLFGLIYRGEARYCIEHKKWYTYHDGAWRGDEGAILVSEKLKDFVRLMILYADEIEDQDVREDYKKFVNKMGDRRMRDRILKDATGDMAINVTEFDNNPYLINCLNGTYDLKTQEFYEHRREDFLTMQTAFSHTVQKSVRCHRWEQFIDEVCEGDKDKADFLQRALGYSILGKSNEECMFILHGRSTRNGKSTLLNTIETLLGDYAKVAPVGIICKGMKKDPESASPTLAGLKGKRIVTMAESSEYGALDEETIKQLTGGEAISARALYQAAVTYTPQFTIWLSCNTLPRVSDRSLFRSSRIKVIEFNRHFGGKTQDKSLKEYFTEPEQMKGVFNWLIEGYVNYQTHGLDVPESIQHVIDRYSRDNDAIRQFLEARCERAEGNVMKTRDLYKAYKMWAKTEGQKIMRMFNFKMELETMTTWCKRVNDDFEGVKLKGVM